MSSELWTAPGVLSLRKPAETRVSARAESERQMKVGIIGAGAVGSACVTALVSRACARDIVVVNRDRKKARGLVTDVQYGAVLSPAVELRDGDYADLQGASLVMITAGANEKTGGATDRNDPAGRLRLLDTNVDVQGHRPSASCCGAANASARRYGPAGSAGRCSAPAGA